MARFFNFYDPLEKRYVFNSFLVVVGLVEILILVFTLIWQIDFEGIFADAGAGGGPFPLEGIPAGRLHRPHCPAVSVRPHHPGLRSVVSGGPGDRRPGPGVGRQVGAAALPAGSAGLHGGPGALLSRGRPSFVPDAATIKVIGLGGSYLLIALLALALLYLPLRLWLRYRLQKQAMEYQYLLTLAERHGVVVVDPKLHPELAAELAREKKFAAAAVNLLPAPDFSEDPDPNKSDL